MTIVNIDKILHIVRDYELNTTSRRRNLVWLRATLYNFMRENSNFSLDYIGDLVNRDHASVLHGLRLYKNNKRYNDFQSFIMGFEFALYDCLEFAEQEKIEECNLSVIENKILYCNTLSEFRNVKKELKKLITEKL